MLKIFTIFAKKGVPSILYLILVTANENTGVRVPPWIEV